MSAMNATLPLLPSMRRGNLAAVDRDDAALADQLLQQRLKQRMFGEAPKGVRIAGYTLESRVGEGAMGVVYRAHDPELDRSVALKLMRPELTGAAERIREEARALARLAHPNVVSVHEIGEFEGQIFVAMEYVDGVTLRTWLAHRRVDRSDWRRFVAPWSSLAEVVECFVQAARGLGAAPAAGLVHRDFKPDNVLVGADGRVRVVDFGIASHAGMTAAEVATTAEIEGPLRTRTGDILGTPAYMAPEQFIGGVVDARTDQFALCVALYEAVCGARPFAGEDLQALMRSVVAGELRPPPRWLPAGLRAALIRGLARDPARRFPSVAALIEALAETGRPRLAALAGAGLVVATGALMFGSSPGEPPVRKDMPEGPAELTLLQRAWQALPTVCVPEPPITDRAALQREIQALGERARKEVAGSPAQLEIQVQIFARMVASGDRFACRLGPQLLAGGLSQAQADRTRCLMRSHCDAPAAVQCPVGLSLTKSDGCAPVGRCAESVVQRQVERCVTTGDAPCCTSALILREYEQRAANTVDRPESRAERLDLAERACAAGVAFACADAAGLGSPDAAARQRRACTLGHLKSCASVRALAGPPSAGPDTAPVRPGAGVAGTQVAPTGPGPRPGTATEAPR